MLDAAGRSDVKKYKSPLDKLVKFFRTSRDKWKSRYLEAKYEMKLLRNQVRYLEKRKAQLKIQIKDLEKELSEAQLKKNT